MIKRKSAWTLFILCYTVAVLPQRAWAADAPPCQIVVDANRVVRELPSNPTGFCLSFPSDGEHSGQKPLAEVLAPMHLGSLRYPMGTLAENYLFHDLATGSPTKGHLHPRIINRSLAPATWDWIVRRDGSFSPEILDFDQFMELCHKTDAEPVVLVATYGHLCPQATIDQTGLFRNAEQWVRYANVKCRYGVRYWEIGNEVDLKEPKAVMSLEQYLRIYRELATRMKAVDPTIHTGLGISHSPEYCKAVLQQCPNLVDFVVAHQYEGPIKTYDQYAHHKHSLVPSVRMVLKAIDDFAPAERRRRTEVLVTEFSSYGKTTDPVRRANNIFNALCTFEMLAEMVAADSRVRFTHFWITHNPWGNRQSQGYDVAFAPDNTVLPQGRAVEIMARFIGDRLVEANASTPALSAWASVNKRGAVAVWLLNRDQTSVPASLTFKGLSSVTALQSWILRGKSPQDLHPYWGQAARVQMKSGTASIVVPPLSVLVLYSERFDKDR